MKLFYLFLWGDMLNCVSIGTVSLLEHLHYVNLHVLMLLLSPLNTHLVKDNAKFDVRGVF